MIATILPAAPGSYAIYASGCGLEEDTRPTIDDVYISRVSIIAWRIEPMGVYPVYTAHLGLDYHLFVPLTIDAATVNSSFITMNETKYHDIESRCIVSCSDVKSEYLKDWQAEWDAKHAAPKKARSKKEKA